VLIWLFHFFALYCIAGADTNGVEFRELVVSEGQAVYTRYVKEHNETLDFDEMV